MITRAGRMLALALALAGCGQNDYALLPDCRASMFVERVHTRAAATMDLLFVVDSSASMQDEQASLTRQLPTLVSVLATGDRNRDGVVDFAPVPDLHVAVVTADLGSGDSDASSCPSASGDGALLRTRGSPTPPGCMTTYPPYLAFVPGDVEAARLADDLACVGRVGTGGCGIEQPLEAALEALTPSASPLRFAGGTLGRGDRENAGFLRDQSTLAIVVVTDEDDCSLADATRADRTTWTTATDPTVGCTADPAALHPISRYVDGFRALRPGNPDMLVFGAVAGVPPDLVVDPIHIDYDALLADDRMHEGLLPGPPPERRPACDVPGRGRATPARRIAQVARELGANATLQSICQEDSRPVLDLLVTFPVESLTTRCLPRALTPDAAGLVACTVTEIRPASGPAQHCDATAGRTLLRMSDPLRGEPTGREVCAVPQVPEGAGIGWYYDASPGARCPSLTPQLIALTAGAEPPPDSEIVIECVAEACSDAG